MDEATIERIAERVVRELSTGVDKRQGVMLTIYDIDGSNLGARSMDSARNVVRRILSEESPTPTGRTLDVRIPGIVSANGSAFFQGGITTKGKMVEPDWGMIGECVEPNEDGTLPNEKRFIATVTVTIPEAADEVRGEAGEVVADGE